MMYLRYAGYALVALLAFVFTWVTCPIWALVAAILKRPSLPGPLAWVHTHDDNVFGANYRRSNYGDIDAVPASFGKRFKTACWWIWRNPNYGFNAEVLGLPVEGTKILQDIKELDGRSEKHWTLFDYDGTKYFGWFQIIPLSRTKYMKLWLGWQYHPLKDSDRYMLKFAFHPYRTFDK